MKKTFNRNALLIGMLAFVVQLGSCGMKETMAEAMRLQNAIKEEFEVKIPSISFNLMPSASLSVGVSDKRVSQVTPEDLKILANEIHEFILEESEQMGEVEVIKIWFVEHDWEPEEDSKYTFSFKKE